MSRPIDKLLPYMSKNSRNDAWYPEVPYGISFDQNFIELVLIRDDRIFITCNGKTTEHDSHVQNQFSIWKLELIG